MPDGRLMGNNVGPGGSRQHLASTSAAEADYGASPRLSHILRNNPEGSSMMSLSDDHFDQYVINRPNAEARLRRNRPSLTRQSEVVGDASNLNRRSTLASSRDRQAAGSAADFLRREHREGDRGSLPNLDELEEHGVHLRREDAARLASQRRQEEQRLREEEELLRANPLRYLYHPALRNWLYTWKVPLILVAANLCLLYILIELLVHKSDSGPAGPERHD
ncbi:junctophilin [Aphelenchoides avenae]|nr:junctophilin [Aphelenchus avenae]